MSEMNNKAVVITGASTGIGRACALGLDRRGFRVFAGVRREADGEALKREASDRLEYILLDVTDPAAITRARERVAAAVGDAGLWGLMNNAGLALAGPMEFVPLDKFSHALLVNVSGVVAVTQAFLPLIRQARGRIIITSSESGRVSLPFLGPYCAGKHAVEAVGDALRIELQKFGVRVSLLEPGSIDTPIWDKSMSDYNEVRAGLSPDDALLYRGESRVIRMVAGWQKRMSAPAEKVVRAAAHALTAARPRARYVIGWDARALLISHALIPTAVMDWSLGQLIKAFGRK